MPDALVGISTTRELYLEAAGLPVTGALLTYTLTDPSGTLQTALPAILDEGGGYYSIELDGTLYLATPGRYTEQWSGTAGTTKVRRDGYFVVAYPQGPLLTRWEVRHQIADLVGDLTLGTATGGSALSLVDTERAEGDNSWDGARVYLYGGAGAGQERRVTTSTASSGTLAVATAWNPPPQAGTLYELHRLFSVTQYNRMLNLALQQYAQEWFVDVADETVLTTSTVFEYAVPAGFTYLSEVWVKDTTDSLSDWTALSYPRGEWALAAGRRYLRLRNPWEHGRLRLIGQGPVDLLLRDAAYTDVPAEYLAFKAAALLSTTRIEGPQLDVAAWAQRTAGFHQQAEAAKRHRVARPNAVRV